MQSFPLQLEALPTAEVRLRCSPDHTPCGMSLSAASVLNCFCVCTTAAADGQHCASIMPACHWQQHFTPQSASVAMKTESTGMIA